MIETYRTLLNLHDATFSRIVHEEAIVAIVYLITKANGEKFILKISDAPHHFYREIYFLNHLAPLLPIPKIIQSIEPQGQVLGAILMQYIEGSLINENEFTPDLAFELGRNFALIHSQREKGYGDPLKDHLNSDPRQDFRFKFEEALQECQGHFTEDFIGKARLYFEKNCHLLLSNDGPCIIHKDFRAGNILVHEGKLAAVIDWAGARFSFAEEDFCSIEHNSWLIHKTTFLDGYKSVRPLPDYRRLMSFLRFTKAVATVGFTLKKKTWNTSSANLYQYNFQFLKDHLNDL